MTNGKSPGTDNIQIEVIKAGGEEVTKAIHRLCNMIWKTNSWPEDWKKSVYIILPRESDARVFENNRTIALISHASKILLKVIQKRLEPYIERELANTQAGIRKGRGCRDYVANIRWMMEAAHEYQQDLYMCFIDYSNAFDRVDHNMLSNVFREMGIPEHLIILMFNLYQNQKATVRTEHGNSGWLGIEKGVRQGCILSPYLFNRYSEAIMRKACLGEAKDGIRMGCLKVNNLIYADDTILIATTKEVLACLLGKVKEVSEKFGLFLNFKKAKVMTTGVVDKFIVGSESLEVIDSFIFLGTAIDKTGTCSKEIKRRLALGRVALRKLDKIWKSNDASIGTKRRLVQALVFPVVMYWAETWTVLKTDRKKIDAFELWCWRRILKVPWTKKITNKEILEKIQPEYSLEAMIIKMRLGYVAHVLRKPTSMENNIVLGKID